MDYPIIKQNGDFPENHICPICGNNRIGEPHSFATIMGGAFLYDEEGDSIFPSNLKGFLDLIWHGHHDDGMEDEDSDVYSQIQIIEESTDGQFGLYFCSTSCLRGFFMKLVDDLEQKIIEAKNNKSF